jgi:hypothetical protein
MLSIGTSRVAQTLPLAELSDRQLRNTLKQTNATLDKILGDRPSSEEIRSGRAAESIARGERALEQTQALERELAQREQRGLIARLPLARQLRDAARGPHPASRWLNGARRYSAPELVGETLVADRLTDEDARELETLVRRKGDIVTQEGAEALTEAEVATWERLLGKAAGDEALFERKRRNAQAKAKLNELKDERRVAALPRQPLLAEAGCVQLPRYVFSWLVGDGGRNGDWALPDVAVLVAVLGSFTNEDASVFVGGRFEGEGKDRALVVPGGIGSDLRMHGTIAGSPLENGSGHIRVRSALATLARNNWVTVEQTVGELRIQLGERARMLRAADADSPR